jgi:hypothetical protein
MKKTLLAFVAVMSGAIAFADISTDYWSYTFKGTLAVSDYITTSDDYSSSGWYVSLMSAVTDTEIDSTTVSFDAGTLLAISEWTMTETALEGTDVYYILYNSDSIDTADYIITSDYLTLSEAELPIGGTDLDIDQTGIFSSSTWVAVPEPATIGLFGLGALSVWFIRRSKKAQEEA